MKLGRTIDALAVRVPWKENVHAILKSVTPQMKSI